MQRASTDLKMEFTFTLAKHSDATYSQIKRLLRYGSTHGSLQERDCNYGLSDVERGKRDRIQRKIELLCKEFDASPVFSGDPRGNTVKIRVIDGFTNDWGREGICVPTS